MRDRPCPHRRLAIASNDDGFTLLELLVVLGIIALLATIATPQVLRYSRALRAKFKPRLGMVFSKRYQ